MIVDFFFTVTNNFLSKSHYNTDSSVNDHTIITIFFAENISQYVSFVHAGTQHARNDNLLFENLRSLFFGDKNKLKSYI